MRGSRHRAVPVDRQPVKQYPHNRYLHDRWSQLEPGRHVGRAVPALPRTLNNKICDQYACAQLILFPFVNYTENSSSNNNKLKNTFLLAIFAISHNCNKVRIEVFVEHAAVFKHNALRVNMFCLTTNSTLHNRCHKFKTVSFLNQII